MTQNSIDPISLVRSLVSMQKGEPLPMFTEYVNVLMPSFFTKAFMTAWATLQPLSKRAKIFEGDPLTGFVGGDSLTLVGTTLSQQTDTSCTVTATVTIHLPEASILLRMANGQVDFSLVLEDEAWKIDDIKSLFSPHTESMRTQITNFPSFIAGLNVKSLGIDTQETQIDPFTDGLIERTSGEY